MDDIEGVFGPAVDEIEGFVDDGVSVHLVGPRGSGRSELLRLVADRLDDAGSAVLRLHGMAAWKHEPYGALVAAGIGPTSAPGPRRTAGEMVAALGQQLRGRAVVVVDDADDLDPQTVGALLTAHRQRRFVALTSTRPHHTVAADSLVLGLSPAVRVSAPVLGLDEVHELTRRILGGPVDAGTIARIAMKSGGLHGLVSAMTSVGRRTGHLVESDGVWVSPGNLWTGELAAVVEPFLAGADDAMTVGATTLAVTGPVTLDEAEKLVEREVLDRLFSSGLLHHLTHEGRTLVGVYPPLLGEYLRREGSAFGRAHAPDLVDLPPAGAADDPLDAGGADAAVLNQRLVRESADRAAAARAAWAAAPTPEQALELVTALRSIAAPARDIDAVVAATDLTAPGVDTELAAKVVCTVATWRAVDQNDLPTALADLREAESSFPSQLAMLRATAAHLEFLRDRVPVEPLAGDSADSADDAAAAEWLTNVRVEILLASGRVDDAREVLAAFEPRRASGHLQKALCRGFADVMAGDLEAGIEHAFRHLTAARRQGDPLLIQGQAYVGTLGLGISGRLADAAHLVYRTLSATRVAAYREIFHTGVLVLGAEIALTQGRVAQARTLAAQALATDRGTGPYPGMVPAVVADFEPGAASAAGVWDLAVDRLERGYSVSAVFLGIEAVERGVDAEAAKRIADAAGMQGRLLPALGRYLAAVADADTEALATVRDELEATGAALYAVRASISRALALRAQGRAEEAAAEADEAWRRSAVAGYERGGLFARLVQDVAVSARELEIVRMIAAPMTTGEVAAELQMSVRTVETHLHNVSKKLGTTGREALVRAATTWLAPSVE